MLGKSEIKLLQALQREGEGVTISTLSQRMQISLSRASELVSVLKEKGFVKVERINKKKFVSSAETKHAQLMKDLLGKLDYMDFSTIISGGAINVLWSLNKQQSAKEISIALGVSRASIHRALKRLMEKGVVRKIDSRYTLNPDFRVLNEIAKEAVHYLHRKKAMELSPQAIIVWGELKELIVKAPTARELRGFQLTGPSKLSDYGVPLLQTGTNYYFYSEKKGNVDLLDVVVHTLVIEPKSTRYITYLLILLAKNRADEKLLLKMAENYDVAKEAKALINYLKSRGKVKAKHFPTWAEFSEKATSYGVAV